MAKVAIYVDGFNLYFRMLKANPALKWLDLEALGHKLAGTDELVKVRYFTAWVSGKADPTTPTRQQAYLRALQARPIVQAHFGHFETREKDRQLVTSKPGPPRMVRVLHTEEKGSDVNLATWLLLDGVDGLYERSIVVSNDSDLEEPIRQANARFGKVYVVSPQELTKRPPFPTYHYSLADASSSYRSLLQSEVANSQFQDTVRLPNGKKVTRPPSWT